jgi:uncharacterized SAM-binding protein YcdF (DUF218 family)
MNRLANRRGRSATAAAVADGSATKSNAMRTISFRCLWRRAGIPAAGVVLACLLCAGFFGFAKDVTTATPPPDPRADAIVVLTGGAARIDGALKLLAEDRAARLLISGVNPDVTAADLADLVEGDLRDKLACCVDLGRQALDTIGNAAETRAWADAYGFSSLIVVTSDYHMPRSMTELEGAMPDVALIPFPVSNPDLRLADWWHDTASFTLLVREYGKYLVARARRLMPVKSGTRTG